MEYWGVAPNFTLNKRGREKDFFIQIQGIAVGHGGDDVTNGAFFGAIAVVTPVQVQFGQFLFKDPIIFEKIAV